MAVRLAASGEIARRSPEQPWLRSGQLCHWTEQHWPGRERSASAQSFKWMSYSIFLSVSGACCPCFVGKASLWGAGLSAQLPPRKTNKEHPPGSPPKRPLRIRLTVSHTRAQVMSPPSSLVTKRSSEPAAGKQNLFAWVISTTHIFQQQLIEKQKKKLQEQKTILELKENQRLAEVRWAAGRTHPQSCQLSNLGETEWELTCQVLPKYVHCIGTLSESLLLLLFYFVVKRLLEFYPRSRLIIAYCACAKQRTPHCDWSVKGTKRYLRQVAAQKDPIIQLAIVL